MATLETFGKEIQELSTAKCIIRYDAARNLMFFGVKPGCKHELHDSMRAFTLARELVPNGKVPLLLDSTGLDAYTSEVRTFYTDTEATSLIQCMAIVANTIANKVAANFFIYVTKPSYPTKLFSSKKAAIEWLLSYSEAHPI